MDLKYFAILSLCLVDIGSGQLLDEVLSFDQTGQVDLKAAPWWVQKEEAAKRKCQSSCTENSKGVNTRVSLCDDKEVCPRDRTSTVDFATEKCNEWSNLLNQTVSGPGHQVKHQPVKGNWLACAVFCQTPSGSLYAPRLELDKLNVNAFFPDGVWCHIDRDTNTNFYCQNNLCLPEKIPDF